MTSLFESRIGSSGISDIGSSSSGRSRATCRPARLSRVTVIRLPLHEVERDSDVPLSAGSTEREMQWFRRRTGDCGNTILHTASSELMVRTALQQGARPDVLNYRGQSALHLARNAGVVRALLESGADPDLYSLLDGRTPLHETQDVGIARLLLEAGADPNAETRDADTPLNGARTLALAHLLLEYGARVNKKDLRRRKHSSDAAVAEIYRLLHERRRSRDPR